MRYNFESAAQGTSREQQVIGSDRRTLAIQACTQLRGPSSALIFCHNFFSAHCKEPAPNPSKIRALEFKGEFRRFGPKNCYNNHSAIIGSLRAVPWRFPGNAGNVRAGNPEISQFAVVKIRKLPHGNPISSPRMKVVKEGNKHFFVLS
jgi:hypothetical protein